uniref:Uncharacterized protein n=1 Tax=Marseillevirus LCMAC102 TaxID=2506603 RepID=A0A481YTD6_9VIRU|nr:MAG: hypothetical protein LCMAC102_01440 [Marseillevirus LCMAC102]
MRFLICLAVAFGLLIFLLFVCKWLNFSIIPKGLKLSKPKKFKFPQMRRNGYNWEVYEDSDSDDDEDSNDEFEF